MPNDTDIKCINIYNPQNGGSVEKENRWKFIEYK